ncbi:MAG: hypothetical protein WBD41_30800 [Rhodococcus sp. (in: high G+C Gram-positive bacteria)]|uniref:hypothetical protein n=1 Tax=Rhodococcus sp. EPR-157 TaxID=1813677 RepID=UPI0009EEC8C3|nr:hypothetical protein [Rhodococcus sp. EPR-157]
MRNLGLRCATIAAVFAAVFVGGGVAQAAPVAVPVYQIPATAFAVSGLIVPGPVFATVTARSLAPTTTEFAAPASPSACATTAGRALVKISYLNITTGASGSVTVKPCEFFIDPTPTSVVAHTGSGRILLTTQVVGSPFVPTAGQPSIPGIGTFHAP